MEGLPVATQNPIFGSTTTASLTSWQSVLISFNYAQLINTLPHGSRWEAMFLTQLPSEAIKLGYRCRLDFGGDNNVLLESEVLRPIRPASGVRVGDVLNRLKDALLAREAAYGASASFVDDEVQVLVEGFVPDSSSLVDSAWWRGI